MRKHSGLVKLTGPVFALTGLLCAGQALAQSTDLDNYRSLPFTVDGVKQRLLPADLNGDNLQDLIAAGDERLSIYFQTASGFNFSKPDAVLELPGEASGWDVDNLPGQSQGRQRLLAIIDGNRVAAWEVEDGTFTEADTLLPSVGGFLPSGAYPVDFVRDINGDGLNDLIIPGSGQLELYLQSPEGAYGDGVRIESRMANYTRLTPTGNLTARVGQRVRIPEMTVRDLNDDRHNDLIASSDERIDVFLANDQGAFPARPTYTIDLKALRESVGEVDVDNVDYSNLSGLLAHTYNIQLEDVDGDRIHDLLVREGGKITLFGGSSDGMAMDKPRQVLKSSGNVLGTLLRDEDGDDLKDLWLMRVENVSLGNLFLWLAVSGSVDLETFVYKNEGRRFASRPHRKITVSVKFPSILRSLDMVNAATDPDAQGDPVRAVRVQLDAADSPAEVARLGQQSLAIFLNVISDSGDEGFLGLSDYSRDKDRYVYDLGEVLKNPSKSSRSDLEKVRDRKPDFEIGYGVEDFSPDMDQADLLAWELNNDGRDDFFIFSERDNDELSGVLLLSE